MKKHGMPEMKEGGVNVTPLIDIVMCLIIFFMLVAKIGVTRGVDKIELPNSNYGIKISDLANTLTLNVHDGIVDPGFPNAPQVTLLVNNQIVERKLFEGSPANPKRPLLELLAEFKKTHKDQAKIIMRCDQHLAYSKLETVLLTLNEAGLNDIAYETKREEETVAAK